MPKWIFLPEHFFILEMHRIHNATLLRNIHTRFHLLITLAPLVGCVLPDRKLGCVAFSLDLLGRWNSQTARVGWMDG